MDISIIIVSYNVRYFLRQCLESVWYSVRKSGLDVEVFVVDNDSSDHSVGYLRASFPPHRFPRLHLIANTQNVGFGRANNQALRRAKGRYILFLNPDTIITEDTLSECLRFAESHDDLGALGVKMLSSHGTFSFESRRGLPTPWVAFCKMSGLCSLFPKSRRLGQYYMRYLDENHPAEIEIVSGAFMFCSHKALQTTGGFDEQFFMYGEDIDLSYRFLQAGYRNWYIPLPIIHYKGESTYKGSYRYVHTFYKAMLIFFRKHFRRTSLFLSLPIQGAIFVQAIMALLKQKMRNMADYLLPDPDAAPVRICYYGPADTHSLLAEKADVWNADITCLEDTTTPPPMGTQVVAYDTETYSYGDIISELQQKPFELGTFTPSRHSIIFCGRICH